MGEDQYDRVLETCQEALSRRHDADQVAVGYGASYDKVAKLYACMGAVYARRREWHLAKHNYVRAMSLNNCEHTRVELRKIDLDQMFSERKSGPKDAVQAMLAAAKEHLAGAVAVKASEGYSQS